MSRRSSVGAVATAAALPVGLTRAMAADSVPARFAGIPIIDTDIHLFDPTRPEGVPGPPNDQAVLYQPALPDCGSRIGGWRSPLERFKKFCGRSFDR